METVREIYRGWASGDFRAGAEWFDPDVEFTSEFGVDNVTVTGIDEMRRVWADQLRNWENWHTGEIQELRDLGDIVFVVNSIHGRGRESGVEVEIPNAAVVFRFRYGKIVSLFVTIRPEDALKAAGVDAKPGAVSEP